MSSAPAGRVLWLAGGVFVLLAILRTVVATWPLDVAVRDSLTGWAPPAVVTVMRVVNWGGDKFLLAGLLVALARVILGAHWPSDALAGLALGLALASAAALLAAQPAAGDER